MDSRLTSLPCFPSVFSFHAMVFDEVLPLYFTAPVPAGGLGITRTDFAKALSFFGVIQLIFQFVIYPRLTKYYSTLVLCRLAFLVFIPVYFLFPELSTVRDWVASNASNNASEDWTFRFAYLFLMLIRYSGCCLAFTGLGIMVNRPGMRFPPIRMLDLTLFRMNR